MKRSSLIFILSVIFNCSFAQSQVVTTGNNVVDPANPNAADIVIGSNATVNGVTGTRHDASIMWWSSGSASRISNSSDVFYLSQWSTTNPNIGLSAVLGGKSYLQGGLGIGTTDPQRMLTVGNIVPGVAEAANGGLIQIAGNSDLNGGANGLEFKTAPAGGGYGWLINSPDRNNSNVPLTFASRSNSGTWTERLTLRSENGYVGIGTPSPGYYLDVNGTTNATGQSWFSYGNNGMSGYTWTNAALTTNSIEIVNNNSTVNNLSPTLAFHRYGSGGPQFRLAADGSNVLYLESAGSGSARNPNPYGSGPNNYFSRLHIDGSLTTVGVVGIGTPTPHSTVTIMGSNTGMSMHMGGAPYFGTLAFNRESATGAIFDASGNAFQINNGGDDKNMHFQVYHGDGSPVTGDALVISGSNAYVGIGVPNPVFKLDVSGVINSSGYASATQGFYVEATGDGINNNAGSGYLSFRSNNVDNRMVIDPNGAVGIGTGTVSPAGKFQVNSASSSWIAGNFGTPTGNRVVLGELYGVATIGSHNNALNAWSDLAINTDGGNVSIGTTDSQGYKLAVNGNAIANSMTVKLYPWHDYVFEKSYTLMPLKELADYVNKNHHLPEIPSAAEVEKDGLDLGKMNGLLVKKVEELTLYLIEKEKEIRDLKADKQARNEQDLQQNERLKKLEEQLDALLKGGKQ
jgi:hypothetical protein